MKQNKWYAKYLTNYKPDKSKKKSARIPVSKVGGVIKQKQKYTRKQKHKGTFND